MKEKRQAGGDENGDQTAMAAASRRFAELLKIDCALHNFGVEGAT
jgi:hypothetical protein